MDELNKIISHDKDKFTYYYHVTQEEYDANRILNEGLYTFSDDFTKFLYDELDEEELLKHGYGNATRDLSDYIIVFSKPKDEEILRKLTAEEKSKVSVYPRRIGLINKPDYVIDPNYIVGYIDKKKQVVVLNEQFNKEKNNVY